MSLPHELDQAQRKALLLDFVQEQFVGKGMIADIAIHAPNAEGDQRNHHAHVMLTMRELTGEGFGKKARDWNSPDQLAQWREQWAHHQNRSYERYGVEASVDHRSFDKQGVDREPTQHEGPNATAMRRRGEETRIGSENDRRKVANDNRARLEAALASVQERIAYERTRFAEWRLRAEASLDSAQRDDRAQLAGRHDQQKQIKEKELRAAYGPAVQRSRAEAHTLQERVQQGGLRGFVRRVTGAQKADEQALEGHARSLQDAKQRIQEQRATLAKKQEADRAALEAKQAKAREDQRERLDKATERKERELKEKERTAETKACQDARPPTEAEILRAVERRQQARRARAQNPNDRGRTR